MPLYMDIHRGVKDDITPEMVERDHISDLEAQEKFGVKYIKYWFDQANGTICCLIEAPSKEACNAVHRVAHGNMADQIIEVESEIVAAFLGGQTESEIGCAMNRDGRLDTAFRTVMFTDIVGSTQLTQELGDEESMRRLRIHDELIRQQLAIFGGREVKHTGDGFMTSFVQASAAIECAVAIQQAFRTHNESNPDDRVEVRAGMSAGEPVNENQDFFGAAVQLASRVCDRAGADQVYVANVVRELCIGKTFKFEGRGEVELKGFPDAIRLHEVIWA